MSKKRLNQLEVNEKAADKVWEETYGQKPVEEKVDEGEESEQNSVDLSNTSESNKQSEVKETDLSAKPNSEEKPPEEKKPDWEHMYKVLQGKYNSEIPKAVNDVKQWKENAVALNAQIADLKKQVRELEDKISASETAKTIEPLSKEYPDIGKVIAELNDKHKKELDLLKDKLEKTSGSDGTAKVVETTEDKMQTLLREKQNTFDLEMIGHGIPDWKQVDKDPEMEKWLDKYEENALRSNKEIFLEAAVNFRADICAKYFKAYKSFQASVKKVDTTETDGKDKLEKYLAPNSRPNGKTLEGNAKPIYTREDYTRFCKKTSKPGGFISSEWGGKTEEETEAIFDKLIATGQLG